MRLEVDGLGDVVFPGGDDAAISQEQRACVRAVAGAVAAAKSAFIEMPAGCGATAALVACACAYARKHPDARVVYACRGPRARVAAVAEFAKHDIPGGVVAVGGRRESCGGCAEEPVGESDAEGVAALRREVVEARTKRGRRGGLPFDEAAAVAANRKRAREDDGADGECPYAAARRAASAASVVVLDGRCLVDPRRRPVAIDASTLVVLDGCEAMTETNFLRYLQLDCSGTNSQIFFSVVENSGKRGSTVQESWKTSSI